jgi:hypothetical protein
MADAGAKEVSAVAETETPAEFLASLGTALLEEENIDLGLADILAKHLLTASPMADALKKAKDAILKLARERADPPKPEVADG